MTRCILGKAAKMVKAAKIVIWFMMAVLIGKGGCGQDEAAGR